MRLSVHGLGHRFTPDHWLFQGVELEFEPGQVYALTGPSGSGKSTLLSLLAGWETPAAGRIERIGVHRVCWVFQNPHGSPMRAAIDHVALPILARGATAREADRQAETYLRQFGLAEVARSPFRALSGGEAQRLMLARGIASNPDLLLIDEPTAQLDLATADEVNATLTSMASPTRIVVIATHDARTRDACTRHLDLRDYQSGASARRGLSEPEPPGSPPWTFSSRGPSS
ncbi:MAG: ATP-binding cassette domain-containing protein [Propionibacteriaceae bacterium]|jgi:putative ABC transport system ATP-binding protein/lipoprotein-releasing system ATP-binding protein|nr:ATP-binding cassette domain-containing protein [Propionibacteriaceae bacterium]